jgi:prepilin-type N-terminal cleavage/methylation domain-containing protein
MQLLKNKRGFTLVELLVVIGILGVLAVSLLVALNPAEAQRKSRDTKRLKDIANIQTAIEQYINDGGSIPTAWSSGDGINSSGAEGKDSEPCTSDNWLGIDVCPYLKNVPVDPNNGITRACAGGSACKLQYSLKYKTKTGSYTISVPLESKQNATRASQDGGADSNYFEVSN